MVAEAQRVPLAHELTNVALRPPRVATKITSMAHAVAEGAKRREGVAQELALEVFTDLTILPHSFVVHRAIDNRNAPLICAGEIAVVDLGSPYATGGWYPVEGTLFLIEYTSPPTACERYARRSNSIVQTFVGHRGAWYAGGLRRGPSAGAFVCDDGPYFDEDALADKLIGKVVGIYQPAREMAS